MGSPADNLWVCHTCEMIGWQEEATIHNGVTGHAVEMLDSHMSEAVLELQREERAKRAAAYLTFRPRTGFA